MTTFLSFAAGAFLALELRTKNHVTSTTYTEGFATEAVIDFTISALRSTTGRLRSRIE
jgi:hypothetical protein